jgi:hypothetical protein
MTGKKERKKGPAFTEIDAYENDVRICTSIGVHADSNPDEYILGVEGRGQQQQRGVGLEPFKGTRCVENARYTGLACSNTW